MNTMLQRMLRRTKHVREDSREGETHEIVYGICTSPHITISRPSFRMVTRLQSQAFGEMFGRDPANQSFRILPTE